MDPFSKRLRKQRERSSLQARQLNKNATTILQKQVRVLDKRQQHTTRTLRRDRDKLLQQLEDFQTAEHDALADDAQRKEGEGGEGSGRRDEAAHEDVSFLTPDESTSCGPPPFNRRYLLPRLWETWKPDLVLGDKRHHNDNGHPESDRSSLQPDSPSQKRANPSTQGRVKITRSTNSRGDVRFKAVPASGGGASSDNQYALEAAWLSSWDPELAASSPPPSPGSQNHHQHGSGGGCRSAAGDSVCRYRAVSRTNTCRYFPCSRPNSYHHLVASDVYDILPSNSSQRDFAPSALSRTTASSSAAMSESFASIDTQSTTTIRTATTTPFSRAVSRTTASSAGAEANGNQTLPHMTPTGSKVRRPQNNTAARNSIGERLRGLRQLVQELRFKNEAKRPRAWAVNYGDAVSRRLIRKPVVVGPVAD